MYHKSYKKLIALLVPAHNEELVICKTLISALKVVGKSDLFVVDDGSEDKTYKIARKYTKNVLRFKSGKGKANALNCAISYFQLTKKYQYIFPVDADTRISPDFLKKALKILINDTKEKYACVIGKVTGQSNNWLTSYRMWEYEVSQLIHKKAQEKYQAIIVCPGCATIYRSSLFTKVQIPSDTVTEDTDLTFLIHRQKLGKIAYTTQAEVITQDPYTLKDYLKQIRRWYKGYWQCIRKHSVPWGRQVLDLELLLLTVESLSGGLMMLFLILLAPFIIQNKPAFLTIPILIDLFLFFLPTVFLTVFVRSNLKIIKYVPGFYLIRILNSLVFLSSFFESLFSFKKGHWFQPSRYNIQNRKENYVRLTNYP